MNTGAVCVVFSTAIASFFAQVGVVGDVAIHDLSPRFGKNGEVVGAQNPGLE